MKKISLEICSIFVSVLFCTTTIAQNTPSAQQLSNITQKSIGPQPSSRAPGNIRTTIPNALPSAPVSGVANIASSGNNNPSSMVPSSDEAISVDGFPIQFIWPNNPVGSNLCGAPWPEVQIPGNAKNGGCPFNVPCDNPTNRDANIPAGPDPVKFMQLRWTIIRNAAGDPSSNISLTRVNDLMTELNADFAAWKLEFCLDVVNFVNDGTHYNFEGSNEAAMKSAYGANFTNVINIYVVNSITNPSAGGYAYFPYSGYGGYNYRGGVLMSKNNSSLGTHTLGHELGHTFGLHHTFHGVDEVGTCSSCYETVGASDGSPASGDDHGDYCSDTNPHETNSYSCNPNPGGSNGCDAFPWANVPVDNHMSYSFCSSQFTPHQAGRMHCMIDTYVPQWVTNGSVTCGSLPPVANFTGSPLLWPAPSTVGFVNLTAGKSTVSAWSWNFDVQNVGGVTPATSTVQDPLAVVYANPGLYEIRLIATNPNGTDSLVRTDYIEVVGPLGDCDTLDFQWTNPTPTISYLPYGPGDYADGVPCATLNASPTDQLGMYERFPTPNPGSTVVGGVRMALGFLFDANDDMTVDISIYTDDGTGAPNLSTGYLGGVTGLSPTTDLNVPGPGFYGWRNWPIDPPVVITSSRFHIGIEINPGSAADTMILITSADPEGENDTSNWVNTTNFGLLSYLNDIGGGLDLDLAIIPMLGGYGPDTRITTYNQNVTCDTTTVIFFDTTWYAPGITWQFDFASDGSTFTDTVDPMALVKTYTSPGPETVTVSVMDACGKGNTHTYMIPYYFNKTPAGDFTKDLSNPICLPPPTANCATFTATPADQFAYTWDFGDGTTFTDTSDILQYCFTGPGTYYVDMSVTGYVDLPTDTIFYEDFSTGIGSFSTFDVDGLNPEVNPPFNGTNSTAWVGNDPIGTGRAISTSWYNPVGTADDWMISSAIVLNASSTLRWTAVAYSSAFPDGYEVRISTTSQSVAGCLANPALFTTVAENPYFSPRKIDLALAGYQNQTVYIGFRNISTDMYILGIDDVLVSFSGAGCVSTVQKLDYVDIVDCSVTPPSAAMITPSPTSGCDSATVTFIDNSTNSPTSWVWDFNDGNFSILQNPPPHTYTSPGTYNVQLIVENIGGVDTAFYTINIYATPSMPTAGTNATYCEGDAVTDLTATGSNIEWFSDPGLSTSLGTGSPFTPTVSIGTNTYYVTQTTNGCQSLANTVVLTVNQAATATAGANATICAGSTYTLSGAIGGSAGSSLWTTSGSGGFNNASLLAAIYTPSAGDITAGTVTLTLTTDDPDGAGPCSAATDFMVLTIDQVATASAGPDATICEGSTHTLAGSLGGSASSSIWTSSGTGFFSNTGIVNPIYTPSVADITAGTVTLSITTNDPAGPCLSASDNMVLTIDQSATAAAGADATICEGSTHTLAGSRGGSASSSTWGTSGTGGFDNNALLAATYTPSAADILAGTVTLTITTDDPTGPCNAASDNMILTINALATVSAGSDATICEGVAHTLSGSRGGSATSSTWSTSGTGTYDNSTLLAPVYTPSPADILAGSVTLTITTNDPTGPCTAATDNMTLTINAKDDPAFTYSSGTFCQTASDPVATISGTGGGVFSESSGNIIFLNTSTGEIDLSASTLGGPYTVQYTTGGICPDSSTVSITITTAPDATFSYAGPYCQDGTNPFPTFGVGASAGLFSATPAGLVFVNTSTGEIDLAASTDATYTVTNFIAASGGCPSASANNSVTINLAATVSAGADATICEGDPITLSGSRGGSASSSTWTSSGTGTFDNATIVGATYTASLADITAGTVTLTITTDDPTGPCGSVSDDMILIINTAATTSAGADATVCEGSDHTLSGSIGGSASSSTWTSSGTGFFDNAALLAATYTPSPADITAGTVSLTLTTDDPTGPCNAVNDVMTLTIDAIPTVTAGADITICEGGTIGLSGAMGGGASNITWTTSGTGTFDDATLLTATYTPSPLDITVGAVTLVITSDVPVGPCNAATDNLLITINSSATADAGTDATICDGDTYVLSGSMGGSASSITWTSSGTGTFDNATLLAATYTPSPADIAGGTVTLTITTDDPDGAGPCVAAIDVMVITINAAATVTAGSDATICEGADHTLAGSMGGSATTVTWTTSGNGTFDNANLLAATYTPSPTDIAGGTVTLTVTTDDPDGAGPCVAANDVMVITINTAATVTAGSDATICAGADHTLAGSMGGSATTVTWTTSGNGTFDNANLETATYTPSAADIAAGSVVLTIITDDPAGSCLATSDNITLTIVPALSIDSESKLDVTCNNADDGSITITASGGTGVMTFSVDNGSTYQSSGNFGSLPPGSYTIVVLDSSGCSVTGGTYIIAEPAAIVLSTSSVDETCGSADGEVSVTASGGTGPLTVLWDDPSNSTNTTVTGLVGNTYIVLVTDSTGCSETDTIIVQNLATGTASATLVNGATCNGDCDGEASATISGGLGPFTYAWDDPGSQTTSSATGLCAGTFGVTITDASSCVANSSVTISEPTLIVPFITPLNTLLGTCLGSATASATGGNGPYTYLWSNGQSGSIVDSLCAGPIELTVTDASGCSITATDTIGTFTGILGASLNETMLSINPNPNRGSFQLEYDFGQFTDVDIMIYDKIGALIISKEIIATKKGTMLIDLSNKANGIYFVHVITNSDATVKRVSVIK